MTKQQGEFFLYKAGKEDYWPKQVKVNILLKLPAKQSTKKAS
jgi:hypothetical protein